MMMFLRPSNIIRKTLIPSCSSPLTFIAKRSISTDVDAVPVPVPVLVEEEEEEYYAYVGFPKRFFHPKRKLVLPDLPINQQQVIKLITDMVRNPYGSSLYSFLGRSYPKPREFRDIHKTPRNRATFRGHDFYVRAYIDRYDPDNKVWIQVHFDIEDAWIHAQLDHYANVLLEALSGRPLAEFTPELFSLLDKCIPSYKSDDDDGLIKDHFLALVHVLERKCLLLAIRRRDRLEAIAGSGYYNRLRRIRPPPSDPHETTKLVSDLPRNLQRVIHLCQHVLLDHLDFCDRVVEPFSCAPDTRNPPPFEDAYKTRDNEVHMCMTTGKTWEHFVIWIRAHLEPPEEEEEGKDLVVMFQADLTEMPQSHDSTMALVLFLLDALSGRSVSELTPDFFTLLRLTLAPIKPCVFNLDVPAFLAVLDHLQKKCLLLAPPMPEPSLAPPVGTGTGKSIDTSGLPTSLGDVIKLFSDIQRDGLLFDKKLRPYYYTGHRYKPGHSYTRAPPIVYDGCDRDKVEGCIANIRVRAYIEIQEVYDPKYKVWFKIADCEDCAITRALAGLLFEHLSGRTLSELTQDPGRSFFALLQQAIVPSTIFYIRFLCMVKHLEKQILVLAEEAVEDRRRNRKKYLWGSRAQRIADILERKLELGPVAEFEVEKHTQFNVKIVSEELHGKSAEETHQIVHGLIKHELDNGFVLQPSSLSVVTHPPPL